MKVVGWKCLTCQNENGANDIECDCGCFFEGTIGVRFNRDGTPAEKQKAFDEWSNIFKMGYPYVNNGILA